MIIEEDEILKHNRNVGELNYICNYILKNIDYLNRDAIKNKIFDIKFIVHQIFIYNKPEWRNANEYPRTTKTNSKQGIR